MPRDVVEEAHMIILTMPSGNARFQSEVKRLKSTCNGRRWKAMEGDGRSAEGQQKVSGRLVEGHGSSAGRSVDGHGSSAGCALQAYLLGVVQVLGVAPRAPRLPDRHGRRLPDAGRSHLGAHEARRDPRHGVPAVEGNGRPWKLG